MPLLQAFLIQPSTRRILRKRSGDQGFSLIELVVVVAVLAVLAAIALPNFLNVNKDAQISSAKNTLATIVKECSVKQARVGSATIGTTGGSGTTQPIQSAGANLNGYTIIAGAIPATITRPVTGIRLTATEQQAATAPTTSCYNLSAIGRDNSLPNFSIVFSSSNGTTTKTCSGETTSTYMTGCNDPATGDTAAYNLDGGGTW
jgi:prepilin-type N-terminal cleavage/methylation domain-containing protein